MCLQLGIRGWLAGDTEGIQSDAVRLPQVVNAGVIGTVGTSETATKHSYFQSQQTLQR